MKNFNLTIEFILEKLTHTKQPTIEGELLLACDVEGTDYCWVEEALKQCEIDFKVHESNDESMVFTINLDDIKEVAPNMWKRLYDLKEKNKANGFS